MARERSYGGRTRTERVGERRAQLVAATISLLASEGALRTTMTGICARAGLTERYFYESFRSRDEALVAALDQVAQDIAAVTTAAVEQVGPDVEARVRAALVALMDLVAREPDKARVAVVESDATSALRARRHELIRWFAEGLGGGSRTVLGDRGWPRERALLNAHVFVAGLAELLAASLTGALEVQPEQLVDLGTDLFTAISIRPGATPPAG